MSYFSLCGRISHISFILYIKMQVEHLIFGLIVKGFYVLLNIEADFTPFGIHP